jgi:hypothetical protein
MAQYTITWQCGHTTSDQLYGKYDYRYARIEAAKSQLCPNCYKTQQAERNAKAAAEAATIAQDQGLPTLTGSEKQVTWALTIRREKLAELDALMTEARRVGTPDQLAPVEALATALRAKSDSRYWIDNRSYSTRTLINLLNKQA